MRPRKKILLVDPNETRRSIRSFVLDNKGFRVIEASTARDARGLAQTAAPDVMILDDELNGSFRLHREMKGLRPDAPLLILSATRRNAREDLIAEVFLGKSTTVYDLLDAVRLFAKRKHGPKKGRSVPCETAISISVHATMGPEFLDPELRNRKVEVPA